MKRSLVALLVVAAPAAAFAQAGVSCPTTPTFNPRGDHWAVVPGTPVEYRIQAAGSADAGAAASTDAVTRAANSWNAVNCGAGKANLQLRSGAAYPSAGDGGDSSNVIYWVESGWVSDSSTIALTSNRYYVDTGYIITADMAFNGADFAFRARSGAGVWSGCATTGADAARCYDIEGVALHEFGHFLGLDHVQCTDAVMFPKADPKATPVLLPMHEATGLCTEYPPRSGSGRFFGEKCDAANTCAAGFTCVAAGVMTYGWCSMACTKDADCKPAGGVASGFVCSQPEGSATKFCKPGPHNTGNVDPPSPIGNGGDLCAPCTDASQCSNGMCTTDGTPGSTGRCSMACDPGAGALCPVGMSCITASGTNVCWPTSATSCPAGAPAAGLDELCYDQAAGAFTGCGPDLICFVYKQRATGQVGACVQYCNDTDSPCPEATQTCCYGLDAQGNCVSTPPAGPHHGGCMALRKEGQSCVTPEQSVCQAGADCFDFGDATRATCYRTCAGGVGCAGGQNCATFSDAAQNQFSLCCQSGTGMGSQPTCAPAPDVRRGLGIVCAADTDCDSGKCTTYSGGSACTRTCNDVTGAGCPGGNVDMNGDGKLDGHFVCKPGSFVQAAFCWPEFGPMQPGASDPGSASGCGCRAGPAGPGEVAATIAVWLGLAVLIVARRRRGSRG